MNELRDEIELPKLEWREMLAYEPVRCIEETCALEHAGEYEIRAEREAQLKSSLAANREQKAEIERLTEILNRYPADWWQDSSLKTWFPFTAEELDRLKAELASLRASVGDKWIEIKEGCEVPEYGETIHAICTSGAMEPWQEVFEATFTMGWEEMAACGVTYWKRLKWPVAPPPTIPGEEK